MSKTPQVRKGQGSVQLSREEFVRRLGERFYDPAFDAVRDELNLVLDSAWATDTSVQGVRVHGHAAVPLAMLVLSEPRHGAGERLDGRDLPAMGGRAWRPHRHARVLVPGAERPEADD